VAHSIGAVALMIKVLFFWSGNAQYVVTKVSSRRIRHHRLVYDK